MNTKFRFNQNCLWITSLVLSITMLSVLFHWSVFKSIPISSLWQNPCYFIGFYSAHVGMACVCVALMLLVRQQWFSIVANVVILIYVLAELIYVRSNGIFIDPFSITMIGNMKGFWGSIFAYIFVSDLFFILPFSLSLVSCFFLQRCSIIPKRIDGAIVMLLGIFFCMTNCFMCRIQYQMNPNVEKLSSCDDSLYLNCFSRNAYKSLYGFGAENYLRKTSVLHSLVYNAKESIRVVISQHEDGYTMSNEDYNSLAKYCNYDGKCATPQQNLQLILVESLESWVISPQITPNIYKFVHRNSDRILCANRVSDQTRGGHSSDGQLILNTGILPLQEGAVCFRYPNIYLPSLSELYDSTAAYIPGGLGIWNQKRMSDMYEIKSNVVCDMNDADVVSKYLYSMMDYQYNLLVTISSHSPYDKIKGDAICNYPSDIPTFMRGYMNCIHYMDSCVGEILNMIDTCQYLRNSVIVITGDHTGFSKEDYSRFEQWREKHSAEIDISNVQKFVPFIVYNPMANQGKFIEDVVYQMDMFPTILSAIGCKSNYWHGFGENLYELTEGNRSDAEAFTLSDKVIRSNCFFDIKKRVKHRQRR